MKKFFWGSLLTLLLAVPSARAQICRNPVSIQCGERVSGATSSTGSNRITIYGCSGYSYEGPENFYLLHLDADTYVQIDLYPDSGFFTAWDAILAVLPALEGECFPSVYAGCDDTGGAGVYERVQGWLPAGDYFLVVDGYSDWDYGYYEMSVSCTSCPDCADRDGDGFWGYQAQGCPCGADCNDSEPAIGPAALEICGNAVDENCDGSAPSCPTCSANLEVSCGASSTANTSSGSSRLNSYCGTDLTSWSGREYVFTIAPQQACTVVAEVISSSGKQLDVFAFHDYGNGTTCNKDACVDYSAVSGGQQQVAFYTPGGQRYYLAVDGRNGVTDGFSYSFQCIEESCPPGEPLICATPITASTSGGTNNLSAYAGLPWHLLGPEKAFEMMLENDAQVHLVLRVQASGSTVPDLALLVLEDDGQGGCGPAKIIAASDNNQSADENPPEVVDFHLRANRLYHIIVDGYSAADAGAFTLTSSCAVECAPGLTDCHGACVDTASDLFNCGGCDQLCQFQNARALCISGVCQMGECDGGFADCNGSSADGCETQLGTLENCAACGDACSYPHAQATCNSGVCQMGACESGYDDCNHSPADGCEADLSSSETCGSCAVRCQQPFFCSGGVCTDKCPTGQLPCGGKCIDVTSDPQNCGGCGLVCSLSHAKTTCSNSICVIVACDAQWGDCNNQPADGCEAQLGTVQNCSRCGDACSFANAQATCSQGVCQMLSCHPGYGDCDATAANGCESPLNTSAHCGSCTVSCPAGQSCIQGRCQDYCEDSDGDGHGKTSCGGDDCNDNDRSVYPGAREICGDSLDQDCDGKDTTCPCQDGDGDGHMAASCGGNDCNDLDGYVYPGAPDQCDGADSNCDGKDCDCPDADGDGHLASWCGGDDCNDNNSSTYPGRVDTCGDGVDQNCDGQDTVCPVSESGCACASTPGGGGWWLPLLISLAIRRRRN